MEPIVDQQNFYLGCRVCRRLLAKASSYCFSSEIPEIGIKYSEAYFDCTEIEVIKVLLLENCSNYSLKMYL